MIILWFNYSERSVQFRLLVLNGLLISPLRIDKGSPGGALYLGTCIHGYGSCNGILYKL